MITLTNQDAYNALTDSITLRWDAIIRNNGRTSLSIPDCHLCEFTSMHDRSSCNGCPIDRYNEEMGRRRHSCCTEWRQYWNSPSVATAKAVRKLLVTIRKHYFGTSNLELYKLNYRNYRKALDVQEFWHNTHWMPLPEPPKVGVGGTAPDMSKCPACGGPADNGHDRCYPPSPYFCTKCEVLRPKRHNA